MNIITFLKKNENARKIFGKRELVIIEKQLLGINLTQSEKNRLSKDIRKKFEFVKEISRHNFDFRLKKGTEIRNRINEIKEHILDSTYSSNIKKIILFGSTAENQRRLGSDIDIAVEFYKIESKEAAKFRYKFNYDEKIDTHVYNFLPDKIKKEIDEKGRIIYGRKNQR
jgi:predicted nucleotidyltransferase